MKVSGPGAVQPDPDPDYDPDYQYGKTEETTDEIEKRRTWTHQDGPNNVNKENEVE